MTVDRAAVMAPPARRYLEFVIDMALPDRDALEAVGAKLKALKLTIRNAPEDQPAEFAACIFSGAPGVEEILIGRAY